MLLLEYSLLDKTLSMLVVVLWDKLGVLNPRDSLSSLRWRMTNRADYGVRRPEKKRKCLKDRRSRL